MDILQKLVRANALLLQGAYQGAEHVLDSAIVDVLVTAYRVGG